MTHFLTVVVTAVGGKTQNLYSLFRNPDPSADSFNSAEKNRQWHSL